MTAFVCWVSWRSLSLKGEKYVFIHANSILLSFNLHSVKQLNLKHTAWWILPPTSEVTFPSPQKVPRCSFWSMHPTSLQRNFYYQNLGVFFFVFPPWTSYKWSNILCTLFCLASLVQCNIYEIYVTACICCLSLFISESYSLCECVTNNLSVLQLLDFFFSSSGLLRIAMLWTLTDVQVSLWSSLLQSKGLGEQSLGHRVCLPLLRTAKQFSKVIASFYIQPAMHKRSGHYISSPTLGISNFFLMDTQNDLINLQCPYYVR